MFELSRIFTKTGEWSKQTSRGKTPLSIVICDDVLVTI